MVKLPDCIDEWLLSNIKRRYIKRAIKEGKQLLPDGKEKANVGYTEINDVISVSLEETKSDGESAIETTEEVPSFYGKSIVDFSYNELQDFAVAFGLHDIPVYASIDKMRGKAVESYLLNVKKINKKTLEKLSFFRYDEKNQKVYFKFSNSDKEMLVISKHENVDINEYNNRNKVKKDIITLKDIMNPTIPDDDENNLDEFDRVKNYNDMDDEENDPIYVMENNEEAITETGGITTI